MKAVVIGGSGFVGLHVAAELSRENPDNEVVIFDISRPQFPLFKNVKYVFGDVRNPALLDKAIYKADEVYDCAGLLGTSELIEMAALAADTNIVGCLNILDACRRENIRREADKFPGLEVKIFHPTKPCFRTGPDKEWENVYTITKFTAERFCMMYKEQFGLSIAVTRWLNCCGDFQHLFPIRKAFPLMIILALNNLDLEIYGDGQQTVDVIDVRDIAKISLLACRKLGHYNGVVEVGSGSKTTVVKMAEDIISATNSQSRVKFLPMRSGEVKNTEICADTSNLKKLLGYDLQFSYEQTLKDSVDWYSRLTKYEVRNALQFYGKGIMESE
jgi:UDP-glucose 4-epimerase